MEREPVPQLQEHIEQLERSLRRSWFAWALVVAAFAAYAWSGLPVGAAQPDEPPKVLRVRGLVIVDDRGRERILLGAPVPQVPGRKRQDLRVGLVLLSEQGVDRVTLGFDPEGTKRISPQAGLNVYGQDGQERGGFGVHDNGRVVLGLDYPNGREGVSAFVMPQEGFAGLMLGGDQGSTWERVGLVVSRDGKALLKLADTNNSERAILLVEGESAAKLLLLDPKSKQVVDALATIPR